LALKRIVLPSAPDDVGKAAARLLMADAQALQVHYIEGPQRYSCSDVADAFARALNRPVALSVVPREQWRSVWRSMGFSETAADSYARMTEISVDQGFNVPDDPMRGATTLELYVQELVGGSPYSPGYVRALVDA
jgi:uncharacterized protein YbjT (DUF2867 family)